MHSFQIMAPAFLPSAAYFLPLLKSRFVLIADHIQYKKRSLFTRSTALRNALTLTIPIKSSGYTQALYKKEIAYIENWDRKHLTSLYHHYHMFPYFDDYFFKLEDIYKKHHSHLNNFLFDQIILFSSALKINCNLKLTSNEGFTGDLEGSLIGFSQKNSLKIFIYNDHDVKSGYINTSKLNNEKIETTASCKYDDFSYKHLNILEFLFRFGPEAAFKIREV